MFPSTTSGKFLFIIPIKCKGAAAAPAGFCAVALLVFALLGLLYAGLFLRVLFGLVFWPLTLVLEFFCVVVLSLVRTPVSYTHLTLPTSDLV